MVLIWIMVGLAWTGAQTSIMQNLTYFEHLSEPMAELLTILEKEFDHTQLTEEILRCALIPLTTHSCFSPSR